MTTMTRPPADWTTTLAWPQVAAKVLSTCFEIDDIACRADLLAARIERKQPYNHQTALSFAITFMMRCGLLERVGRGKYRITESGRIASENPQLVMWTLVSESQRSRAERDVNRETRHRRRKNKMPKPLTKSGQQGKFHVDDCRTVIINGHTVTADLQTIAELLGL